MKPRYGSALVLLLILVVGGAIYAGDPQTVTDPPSTNIPENLKDYYYAGLAPEKLSYAIDLWYDAVLKGDDRKASRLEYAMVDLVQKDIDSTRLALAQFDQYYDRTQAEALVIDSAAPHGAYLPVLEKLDQDVYSEVWEVYKTKQKLFEAINHSPFPSNKYRLVTDYIDVLRRQIGLPKLKIVSAGTVQSADLRGQQGSHQEN